MSAEDDQPPAFAPGQARKIAGMFSSATIARDRCTRCRGTVYAQERETSAKDATFHKQCFSCAEPSCRQRLTHNNARTSPNKDDREVYCVAHAPKLGSQGIGPDALAMLRLKRLNDMQRKLMAGGGSGSAPMVDANAAYISQSLFSQSLLRDDKKSAASLQYQFPAVIVDAEERYQDRLVQVQQDLEALQKAEEDSLYKKFEQERRQAVLEVERESKEFGERKLKDIVSMLEKTFRSTAKDEHGGLPQQDVEQMILQQKQIVEQEAIKQLEAQKKELIKSRTYHVMAQQQLETSRLVDKHSAQMLQLIDAEKRKLQVDVQKTLSEAVEAGYFGPASGAESLHIEEVLTEIIGTIGAPAPQPPRTKKKDVMPDDGESRDDEFDEIFDRHIAQVAETEQGSFTELVHQLTGPFSSELAKARAIYRWITYKDLNVIQFTEVMNDSPMGLLRGIKYGTETYHTLFKRLCSFAGLHCVEICGKSKSVGYEPGMKFEGNSFRNTWNGVLVDGNWRLVQCNWGARYLMISKDNAAAARQPSEKDDSIRYQYDEHYFCTDPEEFIQEFFPDDPKWQLLNKSISTDDFEQLPLVRAIFFHFGLKFKGQYKAVMEADGAGGVDIRLVIPPELYDEVTFLYQLRFADKALAREIDHAGTKLERFVFQAMHDNEVAFSTRVPAEGSYYLQIFASRTEASALRQLTAAAEPGGGSQQGGGGGLKLKCVCKFKIVSHQLSDSKFPLPNCAPGEWGPKKAANHFGLVPATHARAVIQCEDALTIAFKSSRPLVYLARLKMNEVEDSFFEDFVETIGDGDGVTIKIAFPAAGQYGLDLYAKRADAPPAQQLVHACKYLINASRVLRTIDFGLARMETAIEQSMGNWGAQQSMEKMEIVALSHPKYRIRMSSPDLAIRLQVPSDVAISYHFAKEPSDDYRDFVAVSRESETVLKLSIQMLSREGNYMLALYARKHSEDSIKYRNVFNYLVKRVSSSE